MNNFELIKPVYAHAGDDWLDDHMFMDFPFFGFGGGFFMIFFWIALVWLIVFLIQRGRDAQSGNKKPEEKTAIEILKERYAKGEIDKKEFDEKMKDIR